MKFDSILKLLKRALPFINKFRYPLIGALVIALFAITVFRIDYLSASERDEEVYNELITTVENVKFDQNTIDKILSLKETKVDIHTQFPANRTNPF